jgi:hypothetical protein
MKSLLINTNPVVSSLFELCAREESVLLTEVASMAVIEEKDYDILFVDDDAYSSEVRDLLEDERILKTVLLHTGNTNITGFDVLVEKPFLPSQIIKIIQDAKSTQYTKLETAIILDEEDEVMEEVLDSSELEKIKVLLEMDDVLEVEEVTLSSEEYEKRKIEVIKEQLISEGLEIVEEDEIIDKLSADDANANAAAEVYKIEEESKKSKKKQKTKNKKSKKKKIDFSEEDLERIEDAVEVAIATLKRKQMKKLLKGEEIDVTVKLEDF